MNRSPIERIGPGWGNSIVSVHKRAFPKSSIEQTIVGCSGASRYFEMLLAFPDFQHRSLIPRCHGRRTACRLRAQPPSSRSHGTSIMWLSRLNGRALELVQLFSIAGRMKQGGGSFAGFRWMWNRIIRLHWNGTAGVALRRRAGRGPDGGH